jgi:hypothetical protein
MSLPPGKPTGFRSGCSRSFRKSFSSSFSLLISDEKSVKDESIKEEMHWGVNKASEFGLQKARLNPSVF